MLRGIMGDKENNRQTGTHSPWHYLRFVPQINKFQIPKEKGGKYVELTNV